MSFFKKKVLHLTKIYYHTNYDTINNKAGQVHKIGKKQSTFTKI